MENVRDWAYNQEYKSLLGDCKGQRILAMSIRIGTPSAVIGVEELQN